MQSLAHERLTDAAPARLFVHDDVLDPRTEPRGPIQHEREHADGRAVVPGDEQGLLADESFDVLACRRRPRGRKLRDQPSHRVENRVVDVSDVLDHLVEREPEAGLEPAAHALQERCSTN